jgi:hypothetical protein
VLVGNEKLGEVIPGAVTDGDGRLVVVLAGPDGSGSSPVDTELPAAAALADSAANPTVPLIGTAGLLYNGSTWERARGTVSQSGLLSGASSASRNTGNGLNYNHRGVQILLDVTATPNNAETLQIVLQGQDPTSAKFMDLATFTALTASALGAAPTTETYCYTVYPGAAETIANPKHEVQGLPIPRTFRVRAVHSAGGSWTYTVSWTVLL